MTIPKKSRCQEGYRIHAIVARPVAAAMLDKLVAAVFASCRDAVGPSTVQEVRTHLGVETQRQWSDKAIARTTPCLLALLFIVTRLAKGLSARERRPIATAAWYAKPQPTFIDALGAGRCGASSLRRCPRAGVTERDGASPCHRQEPSPSRLNSQSPAEATAANCWIGCKADRSLTDTAADGVHEETPASAGCARALPCPSNTPATSR